MKQPPFSSTNQLDNLCLSIAEIAGSLVLAPITSFQTITDTLTSKLSFLKGCLDLSGISYHDDELKKLVEPAPEEQVSTDGLSFQQDTIHPLTLNLEKAYEVLPSLSYSSFNDYLKLHAILCEGISTEPVEIRTSIGNVLSENEVNSNYLPLHYLGDATRGLFNWVESADLHPLLKSTLFLYEISRLAPFLDHNELTACLWHKTILSTWKPEFFFLDTEAAFARHKSEIDAAFKQSSQTDNAAFFCTAILECVKEALIYYAGETGVIEQLDQRKDALREINVPCLSYAAPHPSIDILKDSYSVLERDTPNSSPKLHNDSLDCHGREEALLKLLDETPTISTPEIAQALGISTSTAERDLAALKKRGKLDREGNRRSGVWVVKQISKLVRRDA